MTTRKRSTLLGPQRAIQVVYPDWQIHMQFFNIQPGEFWNPAWESELLTPRILQPSIGPTEALFLHFTTHFVWIFRIGPRRNWIQCQFNDPRRILAFRHRFWFAVQSFAYNDLVTSAGNYGINGSATYSWQRIP